MDVASNPEEELNLLVLRTPNPYDLIPWVSYFARKSYIFLESPETDLQVGGCYEVRFTSVRATQVICGRLPSALRSFNPA